VDELVRLLNALLMLAAPLALGAYVARRVGMGWRLFFVGAATFIGSQVLHIPFNLWVLAPRLGAAGLAQATEGLPLLILALAYGLSAGVFEEGARYLVYRFWIKDTRRWREAVQFGVGHGGAEAIILGGLAVIAFFQLTAMRDTDLVALVPAERLELARAEIEAYWAAPWYEALAGAVERALALCLQTSFAVLVLQVFTRKSPFWLFAAILWHAVVDALAVVGVVRQWSIYTIEGAVGVMALISLAALFALRPREEGDKAKEKEAPEPQAVVRRDEPPIQAVPPERLEDSRYTG
jgi:uncharacterized membrane protein YhfC